MHEGEVTGECVVHVRRIRLCASVVGCVPGRIVRVCAGVCLACMHAGVHACGRWGDAASGRSHVFAFCPMLLTRGRLATEL